MFEAPNTWEFIPFKAQPNIKVKIAKNTQKYYFNNKYDSVQQCHIRNNNIFFKKKLQQDNSCVLIFLKWTELAKIDPCISRTTATLQLSIFFSCREWATRYKLRTPGHPLRFFFFCQAAFSQIWSLRHSLALHFEALMFRSCTRMLRFSVPHSCLRWTFWKRVKLLDWVSGRQAICNI